MSAEKDKQNYKFDKFPMDLGRVVLSPLILFFRVKKYYVPGKSSKEQIKKLKGALIAANHTGMSDPFILNAVFWYRRFFYTTSEEVMTGLRGKMLEKAGCIRIDRTGADIKAVKNCANVLKDGYLLGLFPQGHIGGDAVKSGVFLIAALGKAPVIPVHIERRKHFWQRHKAVFGEAIDLSQYTKGPLPVKQEIETLLSVFDERSTECRKYLETINKA